MNYPTWRRTREEYPFGGLFGEGLQDSSFNPGPAVTIMNTIRSELNAQGDRYWFSGELKEFPEHQKKLNQYRANRGFTWVTTFYSPCLCALFGDKNSLANHVIFFSKVEDNMLLADLLPHVKQFDKFNYDKMAFQNVGWTYLFIFSDKGELKAVFNREMIYD